MNIEIGPLKITTNKNKRKNKKPMEFSKKILIVAWISGVSMVLFSCYLTYEMVINGHSGDVSLISIILTGGFAEITAGTTFYYWKAKNENIRKIGNNVKEEDEI